MHKREDGPEIAKLLGKVDAGAGSALLDGLKSGGSGVIHLPAHLALKIDQKTEASRMLEAGQRFGELDGEDGCSTEDVDQVDVDIEDLGPVHYAHKLHQAGEAAIQIVCNMAESEFAIGNPRNIPEPLLGWYVMTLTYQLCVLEAVGASDAALADHAGQLAAARKVFDHYETAYGDGVREEVAYVLANRKTFKGDGTYGGKLP